MSDAAGIIYPEQKTKKDGTALSGITMIGSVKKISDDLTIQLKDTSKQFLLYSLALDESTDVKNTAQLHLYVEWMLVFS